MSSDPTSSASATGDKRRRILWAAMWLVSVVLAYLLGTQSRPMATPNPAPAPASPPAASAPAPQATPQQDPGLEEFLLKLPRRQAGDALALGRTDAKVVLTNWSDYRCPFCAVWHQKTLPDLMRFVDDGTLRIEFRDLSMFGEQSDATAVAARAAGEQGRFWEYQEAVFAAAPSSGHPDIQKSHLLEFARTAGVPDLARFETDLARADLLEAVRSDSNEARQLGISGTPFFVVGTRPLSGAQPSATFVAAIEAEAAR